MAPVHARRAPGPVDGHHAKVVLNPPSNEPVDTTPMFTPPTTCHGGSGDTRTG